MLDLLFYNGKIVTLNKKNEIFTSIGMSKGKILHLGKDDDIFSVSSKKKIDLKGKTLIPGFNDTHIHMLNLALVSSTFQMKTINSIENLIYLSKKELDKKKYSISNWLFGRGWNQEIFKEKRFLEKKDLDKISTTIPIFYIRVCGHIATANSLALSKILTLEKSKHLLQYIDISTGILKETAVKLCYDAMDKPSQEQVEELIKIGQNELLKYGVTSIGSDDLLSLPGKDRKLIFSAYRNLVLKKELKIRVSEQSVLQNIDELKEFLKENGNTKDDTWFRTNILKILQDGSLGARTASLIEGYSDDLNNYGLKIHNEEELYELMKLAHISGLQIAIHCIGDESAKTIINLLIKINSLYPRKDVRHGIVHAQILNEDILKKMNENSIMAYIQPIFIDSDMDIIYERIGKERSQYSYIWNTMKKRGIKILGGSDAPVVSHNIMENIHCAITRNKVSEKNSSPFLENEKLSVLDSVKLFTSEAAYSTFEENKKGTLELGKFADMIILSEDIFSIPINKIKNTSILKTIVNGEIVFTNK